MITKAIIPVAGKGTRFLPVTKIVCKTLFPIINKPTIQYLLEELLDTTVKDVYIVISDEQTDVKEYFNLHSTYYNNLKKDYTELANLSNLLKRLNITFVTQNEPKGLGDAILCCKDLIGDDDFAVMLGDDLVLRDNNTTYGIGDLINQYDELNATYIGVKEVPSVETFKYGIVKVKSRTGRMELIDMVEKPLTNPPSNFACVGRYVLKNNILSYLEKKPYDGLHEVQLTDAFIMACRSDAIYAYSFKGTRYDVGDHAGYVKANIACSLQDEKIKNDILSFIKDITK